MLWHVQHWRKWSTLHQMDDEVVVGVRRLVCAGGRKKGCGQTWKAKHGPEWHQGWLDRSDYLKSSYVFLFPFRIYVLLKVLANIDRTYSLHQKKDCQNSKVPPEAPQWKSKWRPDAPPPTSAPASSSRGSMAPLMAMPHRVDYTWPIG